ncbi:MAG TPA: ABC transporter permease [Stellaceae bacterium]|jgi:peptide/nickel transport system permease protein
MTAISVDVAPANTAWRRIGRWLRGDLRAAAAVSYLGLLLLLAVLAPLIAPYSPTAQDINAMLLDPNAAHWLGTDDLGRDTLSRLMYGAPISLFASLMAVAVGLALGVPIGLCAGYLGGWADALVSRVIETMMSFPGIVLAIGVTGALGIGLINAMIAVGIVFAPEFARLTRSQTLLIRRELYVDAARSFGASPLRIMLRHILPNVFQPILVQTTILLAVALLVEASLSFIGLGIQPPYPSWGAMLARAYANMDIAPAQMYPPGVAILFTALAFNALGESLRAALNRGLGRI